MIIQYNIVVTIVNLTDDSTSKFNKTFEAEVSPATDALLYNNYHVLSKGVYILDMFEDEVNAYCTALGIDKSSVEVDEFEIVSLTDRTDVFFESEGDDNSFSLKPIIKCYVYPKHDALQSPTLVGVAYDSTTIIWSWPEDEQYAHYLIEEAIDPYNEADQSKIIAQLPIGATSYTETGLEPNTPYTRRLINYTDEQTSTPSASVTVMTETVNTSVSLEEYNTPKNYDFTTDDTEREIIEENLPAFHSGIGDGNDLKVYKQMDANFYQKFKTYFEITGRRVEREKRYDQVGFNYKICLEAEETVEDQEGEVTFSVDAYPREEITVSQYMYGTQPVDVYAKLYATIFLRKEIEETETIEITTQKEVWEKGEDIEEFYGNPLNVVFVLDKTNSLRTLPFGDGRQVMKDAVYACIDRIEEHRGDTQVKYCIIEFAAEATDLCFREHGQSFVTAEKAKALVEAMNINGGSTNWSRALHAAKQAIVNSDEEGKFVTYFFSDGFPNHKFDGINNNGWNQPWPGTDPIPGANWYWNEQGLLEDLKIYANALKDPAICEKVACLISNYGGGDYLDRSTSGGPSGYHAEYIAACQEAVASEGGILTWNDKEEIEKVFLDYIKQFTRTVPGEDVMTGHESEVVTIEQPYSLDSVKAVLIETDLIGPFTFSENVTDVYFSQKEKRAVINKQDIIPAHTQLMSDVSVYDLLLEAAQNSPEWQAGYNQPITTEDGDYLIQNLHIKDTYHYADEDVMTSRYFDESDLEDGLNGSVNVYTDLDTVGTNPYGDDCYLVSRDNYVYIDGYTDGIIYDGTDFVTTELNAYNQPSVILLSASGGYRDVMRNRKNRNSRYTGRADKVTSMIKLIEKGEDIELVGYSGLAKEGDEVILQGITQDLIATIDEHYQSPVLNYRFNLEDPDAKTPIKEILPTCNPNSNYPNIVFLRVYYAKNVYITNKNNYVEIFGDDPLATTSSAHMPLTENLYQWTQMQWKHGSDNCWYIDDYLWFMAKPMKKRQEYYDELPGRGMNTFYGMVNGRYRSDNQDGRYDLVVDTPQFNIPTTIHKDTIKIYIMITEFYPDTALVSYKWENPWNNKDGITQVNGDYVTFSSDSLTYKDVEYHDMISTINVEHQEVIDNKTTEKIYELPMPSTVNRYKNYYLKVSTDNADVLAMRYPTEITFNEDGVATVGVAFKGVVNATSQWAPRIHNGYYYLNQHEYFAYSEFDVQANFDTYEESNYKTINGYVTFDVQLRHKAAKEESYSITKDTRSELLQDETKFQWIDDKGLTIRPHIEGVYYREYLAHTYYSPIILFPNTLTDAGRLNVDYYFEDGVSSLVMEVRSYVTAEGKWSDWTPFSNNTIPDVPLSCAYQVKFILQASVQQNEMFLEDYMCCYLDWKDDMDESNTINIVTITDHMIAGPEKGDGIYVSKVIDYGCETTLALDLFDTKYTQGARLYIGYSSNTADNLLLENIKWTDITETPSKEFTGRYFRYKIVIPYGEKVYWLHKKTQTLQTKELLPYITGISMTGEFKAYDVVTNFINTEAFTIPRDGNPHTIFERVIDVIGSDVLDKGYTEQEIEYVKIRCTSDDITIDYNAGLNGRYPVSYLSTPVNAKSSVDVSIVIKNTPYIFVEPDITGEFDVINIIGTPQQFCPITVEDTEGNSYIELHDTTSFVQEDSYPIEELTKYLELKTNRYDTRFKVYIDDEELDTDYYRVVNHLVIFNDFIEPGHIVKVEYCLVRSFIAVIDRPNNTTTIYLHPGEGIPVPEKCKVFFETSTMNNKFIAQDLSLNPIYRTDYKGFIYLTDEHTEPYEIIIHCNPLRLRAGGYDSTDVAIEVLDVHGNPVVSKDVAIDCEYGILTCDSYETDINGVVHLVYESAYIKCTDKLTARVLTDDKKVIEQSISIINE